MKLNKKDQETLDEAISRLRGAQAGIRLLSETLGKYENEMWELANKFAKGEPISSISYATKNSKIILSKEI